MPDPQRKQSAFDVLLGKRKQPSTPPTSALEALEGALTRAGGSLSPASSPNTKRVRTPRGQSSYATCPVCSKTLPRALLEAHTSDCIDTRGAQQAAEPATPPADPGSPTADVEPETQSCPDQQRSGSGAPQHPEDTPPRAASPANPQRASARGGHRQARLDGGAILSAPAGRGSASALSAKAGSSGNGRQTRLDNGMALKQPPSRAASEADATDSSAQAQTAPGVPAAGPAEAGDAAPASQTAPPAGNAFATMMQRQRQLAQVQQFFLERCGDGEWKWHWWLKAPGGDASDASSKGGSGSGSGSSSSRPSSHAVWSASTAVAFSANGPKVNMKLMTNVPPSEEAATEWGWGAAQPSNANEGRWHGGGPHGAAGPLKSALQKNVRLCRGHSAVRIALYLLKDNPIEVLRRLAVICLEDAVLPPAYPALVWLMAATSKGYTLSRDHVNLVLTIVQQIAAVPVRDSSRPAAGPDDSPADADAAADDGPTSDQRLAAIDAEMLPGAAAHVKAMLLRASYGGMQGDQAMLRRYADLWQDRFAGRSGPPPPLPAPPGQFTTAAAAPTSWLQYVHEVNELNSGGLVNVGMLGPMRKADIPLSAIDFHCSTIADDVQQEEEILTAGREVVDNDTDGLLEGIDDAFRKVVWHFRSGVNKKQLMPGAAQSHNQDLLQLLEPLWRVSAGPLDAWSQTFIRKRFY